MHTYDQESRRVLFIVVCLVYLLFLCPAMELLLEMQNLLFQSPSVSSGVIFAFAHSNRGLRFSITKSNIIACHWTFKKNACWFWSTKSDISHFEG